MYRTDLSLSQECICSSSKHFSHWIWWTGALYIRISTWAMCLGYSQQNMSKFPWTPSIVSSSLWTATLYINKAWSNTLLDAQSQNTSVVCLLKVKNTAFSLFCRWKPSCRHDLSHVHTYIRTRTRTHAWYYVFGFVTRCDTCYWSSI